MAIGLLASPFSNDTTGQFGKLFSGLEDIQKTSDVQIIFR